MIPVQGYEGQKVAVLGLGRSGLATARALLAGGATPLVWDDSPEARAKAEAEGFPSNIRPPNMSIRPEENRRMSSSLGEKRVTAPAAE